MARLRAVLVAAGVLLLSACIADRHEVSRVSVPGTELTVVLFEDIKRMHSYQVLERGVAVTEMRLLGPRGSEETPLPIVESSAGIVTIRWRDEYKNHYVEIDVAARKILRDSNSADSPPALRTLD